VPKALKIVAALMVALASAAIGWFGVKWYQDSRPSSVPNVTGSPTPTPTTTSIAYVHLTFDLTKLTAEAGDLLPHPQCGDTWDADAASANGVKLVANADVQNVGGEDHLNITSGYTPIGEDPLAFLGTEGDYIVTRDGKVISPDWGAEYVPQYFVATSGAVTTSGDGVSLTGPTLCDVADQLAQIWANVDFATATPEDIAAAQAASDAFNTEHASLPAGEYKIYAVAPIVLGEPAAIARALSEEGVNDIGTLAYSIGDSPLGNDPRLDDYCIDEQNVDGDVVARNCDVPQDVLSEVLARDVPQAYVVDGAPMLAVSEPVVITIP
jgi:hypothetical protein